MDAHKAMIPSIFNCSTLLEIPFFQRSYVWKEDLWSRLLDDMELMSKTKKKHFLGSIILKEGRAPGYGDLFTGRCTVIDGQQRLTTLLIFLKVLCLKTNQYALFNQQFRIMGQQIALQHGRNDIKAFEQVMSMNSADKLDNPAPESRIIEAYNYYIDHIDASKMDIMGIMRNIQFVRIDLDANENEQEIFDTINSLGVNLTTSELLKNYFFSRDTVYDYQIKWENVFEKDVDTKAYWDSEIETGRIKKAMIDIFFDAYFQLFVQDKTYGVTNEDKLVYARVGQLAQSYQHFINTYCGGDKNVILNRMKEYAECFMKNFRPEQCNMSIPNHASIERINIIIFGLKTSTLIPYVLYVAENVQDTDELNRIYGVLESYIMRRIVVRATTKNYNNLFTSLILNGVLDAKTLADRLQKSSDATAYTPSDADVLHGFADSKLVNIQSKGILYLLESSIRPENSATALHGFNGYSLEHLLPKKWRNNWSPCASTTEAEKRDSMLLTLGNLAIIPQTLNASIRDADWATKKAGKGNKPGLNLCAGGLSTIYDVLNKDIWNEQEIAKRSSWLADHANVVWKI